MTVRRRRTFPALNFQSIKADLSRLYLWLANKQYGSVAEWVMILLTAITAFFLYQTLQSQIVVQKDQHNMVELEREREFRAIKPQLYFEYLSSGRDSVYTYYNYRFVCKKNTAQEVCMEVIAMPSYGCYPVFFQRNTNIPQMEEGIYTDFYIRYPVKLHTKDVDSALLKSNPKQFMAEMNKKFEMPGVSFYLYFKDEEGKAYKKLVVLDMEKVTNRSVEETIDHPHSTKYRANLLDNEYTFASKMKPDLEFSLTNDGH